MKVSITIAYIAVGILLISNAAFILLWLRANGTIGESAWNPNDDHNDQSGSGCESIHSISAKLNETHLKTLLNHITIVDLVDVVEKIPELAQLIAQDFMISKYRIHEKLVHIEGGESMISHDSPDELIIVGSKLIEKMLKYFGLEINKLRINSHHFDRPQMASVYKSINDHCSETLKSLEFHGVHTNPFEDWKHFGSIIDLTIENVYGTVENMEIHEIFPNLKNLAIRVYSSTNLAFIAHKFHHLEHFKLRSHQLLEESQHFTRFLEENPKIQSIDLDSFASFAFIQRIEEKLTNLQKLHLLSPPRDFYSAENCMKKLHFANVREFTSTVNRDEHLNAECIPFVFEKLTTIELITPRLTDKWMEFVQQQKHLKSIRLPETEPTYDQLRKLVNNDAGDVTEISVQWSDKGIGKRTSDGIVEIMKEQSKLDKVVVWSDKYTDCTNAFEVLVKWKPSQRQIVGQRSFVTFSTKTN